MSILSQQHFYRLTAAPSPDLPFGVRNAGYYKIHPPFASRDKIIHFVQFFWCLRGSGIIEFNGRRCPLKQNQVALYYPNARHYWYAGRQYWEFYYFTMDGPLAASLPAAFGLKAGIYDAGPPPTALFRTLCQLVGQPYQKAELRACVTAFTILAQAAGLRADQKDKLIKEGVKHMYQKYTLPTLNIKTLVAELGVQRSFFCARFQTIIGMPPGVYLERLRVQNALLLLKRSDMAIASIALQCGFADASYFSRAIRRVTGYSPLQFRKLCKQHFGLSASEIVSHYAIPDQTKS